MDQMMRKIDLLRERAGMYIKDFAAAARLAENRYTLWCKGQGEPTARQLLRIARVLQVPMEWLADDEQPVDQVPPPEWTPDEILVLRAIKSIGTEEALRRLLRADAAPPDPSDKAAPIAQRLHPKGFDPLPCEPAAKPKPKKRG